MFKKFKLVSLFCLLGFSNLCFSSDSYIGQTVYAAKCYAVGHFAQNILTGKHSLFIKIEKKMRRLQLLKL